MNHAAPSALSLVSLAVVVAACSASPGGSSSAGVDAGKTRTQPPVDGTDPPTTEPDSGVVITPKPDAAVQGGDPSDAITTPEELMAYTGAAPKKLDELKGIWMATDSAFFAVRILIRDTATLVAGNCGGTAFGATVPSQNVGDNRAGKLTWLSAGAGFHAPGKYSDNCEVQVNSGQSNVRAMGIGEIRLGDSSGNVSIRTGFIAAGENYLNKDDVYAFTKIAD